MRKVLFGFFASLVFNGVCNAQRDAEGTGTTTRGWSCCKNSCSWSNKALVNSPVISCDNRDNLLDNPARRDGCESGGGSFACSDLSPWAQSNDFSYGFAGVNLAGSNESAWCCGCYQLRFTSGSVNGKTMIVQFDIAIPGGGQGNLQGCTRQYGSNSIWGDTYGGVSHRDECDAFPEPLKGGCYWRFDWFRNSDNPTVNWEKVTCPEILSLVSGCRRDDDPVPGKNAPTPTKSAPVSSGTVVQGGQCGGKRYSGPTMCVQDTVCTFVDEDHYYCLPDPASTRTTPTTTNSECVRQDEWWSQCQPYGNSRPPAVTSKPPQPNNPSTNPWSWKVSNNPAPTSTIAQLWEQCGGSAWKGATRCAPDLKCVVIDEYYSQCQKPAKKR
ncbi:carbohydrate-binding module family 1 protein [Zopfia rhizophila CBS 207.26]|uniref:cellulase n=1 Tax=Zopfia rhizophila CBS 207.26 TaxID=1314779 RepID=A0A6A6EM60_9PEZI|nr:carbohydrate-binding module family 1 protein [Zopfia rhizophila CBS 207.26]